MDLRSNQGNFNGESNEVDFRHTKNLKLQFVLNSYKKINYIGFIYLFKVLYLFFSILQVQNLTYFTMKLLKKIASTIVFAGLIATTFQCTSSKEVIPTTTFEQPTAFKVQPVYFQEWYAGIKVGGTGINVFVPIENENPNILLDSVYFRNLKGKLIKKDGKYVAILENASKLYTFKKSEKPADYPFTLKDSECAISYIEKGTTKYFKVGGLNEVAGAYYENGPPSIYENSSSEVLATTDDEQ